MLYTRQLEFFGFPSPGGQKGHRVSPKRLRRSIPAALLVLICICASSTVVETQTANLIVNGGFEAPVISAGSFQVFSSIPGWATLPGHPDFELQRDVAGAAFEGDQHCELDAFAPSAIFQDAPTMPGRMYELSFAFSARPGTPRTDNVLRVSWGGQEITTLTEDGAGLSNTSWTVHKFQVLGGSGTTTRLVFEDLGVANTLGTYIDDVRVVETGTPPGCYPNLPTPQLALTGTEDYTDAFGNQATRYNLCVNNWSAFPAALFEAAPDLPACGLNTNASRTWVEIFGDGQRIYGFCALGTPQDLTQIWFARLRGQAPPASVYITLTDRRWGLVYRSNTISTAQFCVPHPPDLVSRWPGDGNANDIGDNNNGTTQNGVTFAQGMVGQTFGFDGVNDVVTMPNAPNLNFGPNSPITVELWAYRTGSASVMHFVGKRTGCGFNDFNYQMAFDPTRGLLFGGDPINGPVITGQQMPLNTWTHLAGTFDGTTFRFYINGALAGTSTGILGPINDAPLEIGNAGSCQPFGGLIDEVTLYNRALSASEIQAIYNAGSAGKCNCQVATGADIAITKTATPNPVLTGSNVTYTITVINNGPGAAANVTVADNLPASTTFVSCSSTGGGVCGGSGNNRTVTFTSLAAGASAIITLIANVNCSLANGITISNTATVNSSTLDPVTNNNSATANVTPPLCASCSIPNVVTARPGRTTGFVISNDGAVSQTITVRPFFSGACFTLFPGYPQQVQIAPGGSYPFDINARNCPANAGGLPTNSLIVAQTSSCGTKNIQVAWMPQR